MKRIERENKVFIGATMMILLGFILILTLPYILTRNHGWFDFTETGQIGDTIGGITAPFIAVCSAYITFLAFWVQYTYNKKQKKDLFQERFENNLFSYLDMLIRQEENCSIEGIGCGKQAFHYMFYEYKALYYIIRKGNYLHDIQDTEKRNNEEYMLTFSIFLNGVSESSTYRLGSEVVEAVKPHVLKLNHELLHIQQQIINGEISYPKYLKVYQGKKLRIFDGHRLRLISYFRMSCMIMQYILKLENEEDQKFYLNVFLSHFSEHQLGLLYLMVYSDEFESFAFVSKNVKAFLTSEKFKKTYLSAITMRFDDDNFICL